MAAYTRMSAVHTGDTLGFPGTGEAFEVEQMHLMRFADDGRIVEHWGVRDDAGMMRRSGRPSSRRESFMQASLDARDVLIQRASRGVGPMHQPS